MRFVRTLLLFGIAVGGLGLASFGVARAYYPSLDEQAVSAIETAGSALQSATSWVMSQESPAVSLPGQADRSIVAHHLLPSTDWAETAELAELSTPSPAALPSRTVQTARPSDPYEAVQHDLELLRKGLSAQQAQGADVVPAARVVLALYLPRIMEAWLGTPYHYSGTSQEPGKGRIACGYYVSTVLEHGGFEVDRVALARQPSEQILRSLVPDSKIRRLSYAKRKEVVEEVRKQGDGIYVVGLDTHVGFLVTTGDEVTFCHATQRKGLGVVCEKAVSSPSLRSKYTVVGKVDDDRVIQAWLDGSPLATAQKGSPQQWPGSAEAEG